MRLTKLLAAVLLLDACIATQPPLPKTVSSKAGDAAAAAQMLQAADAGSLRVRSVVYKPAALPLEGFLAKLSRGELKPALAALNLRYIPSNVHDDALRTLIGRGYAPVLAVVTNGGDKPADLAALRLRLRDSSLALDPIPNEELPREFQSLSPKALAANAYNVSAVVIGSAALIATIVAVTIATRGERVPIPDYDIAQDSALTSNPVFNPVRVDTPIDYNGLLYSPSVLQPGETARGLLFYKVRGADWAGLRLTPELL